MNSMSLTPYRSVFLNTCKKLPFYAGVGWVLPMLGRKKYTVECGGVFIKFRGWVGVLEKKISISTEFWWGIASDHEICTLNTP